MILSDFLSESARKYPEMVALVTGDRESTYRQLEKESDAFAAALLDKGLRRGDRVGVYLGNTKETVVAVFGAVKAGGVFVLINPATKWTKLVYILSDARISALVTSGNLLKTSWEELRKNIPSLAQLYLVDRKNERSQSSSFEDAIRHSGEFKKPIVLDIDLAALIYTSGSTGFPKGVMLTHLNMVSAAHSITTYLGNTHDDVVLNVLPLSFDYGLYQVINMFVVGGKVVLEETLPYPYDILRKLEKYRVTGFPIVPTVIAILSKMNNMHDVRFPSLRYVTNTGAHLSGNFIQKIKEMFPHAKIFAMYGLTECKRVSYLPPEELDRRPTSVGKAMPNVETFIVREDGALASANEIGELVVRGSNVMKGYWGDPEATERVLKQGRYPGEKVLYTGDLFRMDAEGYLYFVARKDDIIKSRGEKVSPKEVENVICCIPEVLESAVIGIPDEILGQAVQAHVVPKRGQTVTVAQVMTHCAENLEPFMVPKAVYIWENLPLSAAGKIDKTALLDRTKVSKSA